jgi:tetratricopeptide (TPR) repeat protein
VNKRAFVLNCSLIALVFPISGAGPVLAQTFEIGGQSSQQQSAQQAPAKKGKGSSTQTFAEPVGVKGFGQGLEFARLARKAEDELKHGNAASAADYTRRALESAPENADLWFMLGYTSRLAGRLSDSVNAYEEGLKRKPNAPDGLAGLAQTYIKMGRNDDAKRLLLQAIASHPRPDDMLMAGELFMQTGDIQRGLDILQRAETAKPSAHAELLMAVGYMKLKQPQRAKQLLDLARRRDPRNTDIFRAVANFQREQKDYAAAIETLKSAPNQPPDLLADLGYTYDLAGDKKSSAASYARAANADTRNIGYQLAAAQAYLDLAGKGGQNNDRDAMQKVQQYLERAAGIDPNHYRLHAIRGSVAKLENRNDEAVREYETALASIPEDVPEGQLYPILLRLNLSELYKQLNNDVGANQQLALAEQQISKLQIEGPPKAEFLRVRASIKMSGNDLAGAEKDLREAMQIDPNNLNIDLQYANLLWKEDRKEDARKAYLTILNKDKNNEFALEALGYLARDMGDVVTAEKYFLKMAAMYPKDYVPYLALGDMYTALYKFPEAEKNYELAYQRAPQNAAVISNGANASLEDHRLPLAKTWIDRATGSLKDDPRVMRETERYLFLTGKYLESAQLGYKVLAKLPNDRNASVYLGYALYNLGRYDDVLTLASKYEILLPKERDFPLLQGHVHKQGQLLNEAVDDYTRALKRDPKMVEAYVNRGYVLNDLQNPEAALADFDVALKLHPENGSALLGSAFSNLQLRHGRAALDQVAKAEKIIGVNGPTHVARATAHQQLHQLSEAEREYRAALKFAPDDLGLHKSLADTLYHAHKYRDSIAELNQALRLAPDDPFLYAERAHAEAQLRLDNETLRDVQLAEQQGSEQSGVLLATGDALLTLGDRDAAMARFSRALEAPDASRVDARLSLARLFQKEGKFEDAKQQIALGFTEARIGDAPPVTPDNLIEAANLFLSMHEFDLAEKLYGRAKESGAGNDQVALGLANTYLAQGNDIEAEKQIASLGSSRDHYEDYDYMLTSAELYRSRHDMDRATMAYARANELSSENDIALRGLHEAAGEQGLPLRKGLSMISDVSVGGILDNSTIYQLDAMLFGIQDKSLLPPGRSSLETTLTSAFRYRPNKFLPLTGFVQERNAHGQTSLPSESLIVHRNTFDTSFNGGMNPVLHLFGSDKISLNTGLQFTIRRDRQSPVELNQNLFRQYVYFETTPLFNWMSIQGSGFHEAGPFTDRSLTSSEKGARLQFRVGRPWGKTALLTGYSVDDLQFDPLIREYFTTSSFIGLERKFGQKFTLTGLAEYIRAWRVEDLNFARAQALSPGASFNWRINETWKVEGNFLYQSGRGKNFINHAYDNMQSGFFISYLKPLRQAARDAIGVVPVEYPIRFSVGLQQQQFMNLTGRGQAIFRPVFRLTLF